MKEKDEEIRREQTIIEKRKKKQRCEEKKRLYKRIVSQFDELTNIYEEIKIADLKKKLPEEIQDNYGTIFKKSFVL